MYVQLVLFLLGTWETVILICIVVEQPPHIALHSDGVIASMRNKVQGVWGGNAYGTDTLTVHRV
jgi:hypothetical protein